MAHKLWRLSSSSLQEATISLIVPGLKLTTYNSAFTLRSEWTNIDNPSHGLEWGANMPFDSEIILQFLNSHGNARMRGYAFRNCYVSIKSYTYIISWMEQRAIIIHRGGHFLISKLVPQPQLLVAAGLPTILN